MNVVIFSAYALNTPHFETELEIAHTHTDAGDDVTMLTCGSELEACDPNPYHDLPRCAKCIARRKAGLALVPPSIRTEPFYRLTDQDRRELDELPTRFETLEELKGFRLGRFDIGFAAISSLISKVREPEPDLAVHASLLQGLLRAGWTVHRSMCRYLDTHRVDRVYVFNGRFAPMRAVLRACQEKGVECYTHERGRDLSRYILLRNTSIHDIGTVHRLIWEAWEAAGPDSDREQIARRWYEARASGECDDVFVQGQRPRRLPSGWDDRKRNISIYVSSEDEFASISDEWSNPLYESQNAALRAIIESLRPDPGNLHLYIRMHPNLALVDNKQTREIATMHAPFVTVIPPSDPADTYELMRSSTSVLTFGSTAGIEAVYWGAPSILVGATFYRDFGVTYDPTTHEELIELLQRDLEPKPIEPVLAYGYFWPTFGVPFKHFTPDGFFAGRFKGVRLRPSLPAQAWIALLRVLYPQRAVRHVKRMVTKRGRILRNKMRHPV